ncbi:MAG: choice-of-anchor X domain-containing protein [Pseudomonadota bacterium]
MKPTHHRRAGRHAAPIIPSVAAWLAALTILTAGSPASADHFELPLSYIKTLNLGYELAYRVAPPYDCANPLPGDNLNYLPPPIASDMIQAVDGGVDMPGSPPGFHLGLTNLGFKAPDFDGYGPPDDGPQIWVYDCAEGGVHDDEDCDNGSAPADAILMPSTVYCMSPEANTRSVMGHELFHHVQFAYIDADNWTTWGQTPVEGTARLMQDMIYTDLDTNPMSWFHGEANQYLANPNRDFWQTGYKSALAWKHLTEQFGTTSLEPQVGIDFLRRFWENAEAATEDAAIDFAATLKSTMRETQPGATLRDWFQDFAIANVAREFDLSLVPDADKYQYIDESAGLVYRSVIRDWTGNIPTFISGITDVSRWGAMYAEANIVTPCTSSRFVSGWRSQGAHVGFAVLAVNDQGEVRHLVRGAGKENSVAFIQSSEDDPIDKLIMVLTGRDEGGEVTWQFDCGLSTMQVRLPDDEYKAYVGPAEAPQDFIIRTVVSGPQSLGAPTVLGLQPGDFEVYVGDNFNFDDEAQVIAGLQVQGEYWLVVRAPQKPNSNTYDLYVNFGGLGAFKPNAVSYEEKFFDQMLVLDTSGSMADPAQSPSLDAAVNAASLFADVGREVDKMGLVTFAGNDSEPDDDATLQVHLDELNGVHRGDIQNRLGNLVADGFTSIGDGIDKALIQFSANGSVLGEDWIVLLSDGVENENLRWEHVRDAVKQAGIHINTIALGPDANQVLLQDIAEETGGQYYYVDTGQLRASRAGGSLSVANELADIYAASSETIKNHERLWDVADSAGAFSSTDHTIVVAEGGIDEATVSINWDNTSVSPDGIVVRRPNGEKVEDGVLGARVFTGATHRTYHIGALTAGTWTVSVTGGPNGTDYIGILAGRDLQGASLDVFFAQYIDDPFAIDQGASFLRGLEQPITAVLLDDMGLVKNAEVRAEVRHPDGTLIDLPLFDDGAHGDGQPGDGVYANFYTRTTQAAQVFLPDIPGLGTNGSYGIVVRASGKDNRGQTFNRIRKGAFSVFESEDPSPDNDDDGMPNLFEDLHACIDRDDHDVDQDSDGDGLSNGDEWNLGLNPCNPDTDRGGESDWSEVVRGANPFDPGDDALPIPRDVEVINWQLDHLYFGDKQPIPEANLIRYPVSSAYRNIRLLRSTSANGPFALVATFNAKSNGGLYHDSGLQNGVEYFYKVQADNLNGSLSVPSHVFSGTPKADPLPPIGSVRINQGARFTSTSSVTLNLMASSDATEMQIGNNDLTGAVWQPFAAEVPWTVSVSAPGEPATVAARFRDAALNESSLYHAQIIWRPWFELGRIRSLVNLNPPEDLAGTLIRIEALNDLQPTYTGFTGEFDLREIPLGTHDLHISRPGYASQVITGVHLSDTSLNVDLPPITLEVDGDGDGIADSADNCTLVANPDQTDSNGDGYGNLCDADLNNDGNINFSDLGLMKAVFFTADADADLDGDGSVNFADLGLMKASFFGPPGPSGTVP